LLSFVLGQDNFRPNIAAKALIEGHCPDPSYIFSRGSGPPNPRIYASAPTSYNA